MNENQNSNLNESNNIQPIIPPVDDLNANSNIQTVVPPVNNSASNQIFNPEVKPKKKNPIIWIIILILLLLSGAYVYLKYFNNTENNGNGNNINDEAFERNSSCYLVEDSDSENVPDNLTSLGVLTSKKFDHFSSLKFENKITNVVDSAEQMNVSVVDNKIVSVSDQCLDTFTSYEIPNIKSIKISCHCGGCDSLYYLTTDNNLYSVSLDHSCMYLDEETNALPQVLVVDDAVGIDVIDVSLYESTTCGGEDLVYKSTDGNTYIAYAGDEEVEKYNINNFQTAFIDVDDRKAVGLNVIYKNNATEVFNDTNTSYVKDESGNKLYAARVFYGFPEPCLESHSEEELLGVLFVITEDDKIYFLPKGSFYNDSKAYLFSNKKVKSIEDTSTEDINKVKITYIDNTYEEVKTSYKLEDYDF